MLAELRTSALTPKNYYELYMAIFDELGYFTRFLKDQYGSIAVVSRPSQPPPLPPPSQPGSVDQQEPPVAGDDLLATTTTTAAAKLPLQPSSSQSELNTMSTDTNRHPLANLYESVQYITQLVPRLYLMISVGSVYMAVDNAPRRALMMDMLDMCKGVQHPTRGLFLRYYMQQMTRNQLPVDGEKR